MFKNRLYFGDNLNRMRKIKSGKVDLICTDPPFNSGMQYCTFYNDSEAKKEAFTDIWTYNKTTEKIRDDIENRANDPSNESNYIYEAVRTTLEGFDLQLQNKRSGPKGSMRAYLTYMAPRLVECHRLLKDTGSIYLHCDPTASHYLKTLLDTIFGLENFRNEIIWEYNKWQNSSKAFQKNHDVILFYSKSNNYTFNTIFKNEMTPDMEANRKRGYKRSISKNKGRKQLTVYDRNNPKARAQINSGEFAVNKIKYLDEEYINRKPKMPDVWTDIHNLGTSANEKLGYPTQKPRNLYERMIKASSNEGDIIFDPFCGTGTTLDAAQVLNRHWVGIDLTFLALKPIEIRLKDIHALKRHTNYLIRGMPTNVQEARLLCDDNQGRREFEILAVTNISLYPTQHVGDGGYDGIGYFTIWDINGNKTSLKLISEVKTGKVTITQVRAFCHTIQKNNAAGIFITLDPVTRGMEEEADSIGNYEHNGKKYPKFQFLQITDELLKYPERFCNAIKLPTTLKQQKKLDRHIPDYQMKMNIETN